MGEGRGRSVGEAIRGEMGQEEKERKPHKLGQVEKERGCMWGGQKGIREAYPGQKIVATGMKIEGGGGKKKKNFGQSCLGSQ